MKSSRIAILCAAVAALPAAVSTAWADAVVLTNGRVIEADHVWFEGAEVRYTHNGSTFGVPRALVQSVRGAVLPAVGGTTPPPVAVASAAVPVAGTTAVAPPPVVRHTVATDNPRFRVRYEGGANEALGLAVLAEMRLADAELSRHLGYTPSEAVTVVLETGTAPDARLPEWAAGLNDGAIRVPVSGLTAGSARLRQLLRHELTHTFVTSRTGGNCPTWLQEGIAQWLEGGDPAREDRTVAGIVKDGKLMPLLTLEGPFQTLDSDSVSMAYAESLSAVAHILRKRGEPGLGRLLNALGDRVPSDEALPVALGMSYPEFQRSWEAAVAAAK